MSNVLHALAWFDSLVPRVEDPLPKRISLGLPFTFAGVGSVLGNLVPVQGSAAKRDRAARLGSAIGFGFGALGYLTALVAQLLSAQ